MRLSGGAKLLQANSGAFSAARIWISRKKRKLLLLFFCLVAFSSIAFAQTVTVTPRKTVYRRPKPLVSFKQSFAVIRPHVRGLKPLALNRKVEKTLSYEKIFKLNVREEIREIQWLEEASYKVNYNKGGILDVTLFMSGSGAYPSVHEKQVMVNLKTGTRLVPSDVFTNLAGLVAKVRKVQQAEMKKATEDYKRNPDARDWDASPYFNDAKYTIKNLSDFTIDEKGVTFIYDYGFPHVALALQPEGRFSFTWAELKPFVKTSGLFAQFVR